jgi:hypothetical protein
MTAPFNYEKSDERGLKVNPSKKSPEIDSLKKVIERGARLQNVRSLSDGTSKLSIEDGELRYDASEKENAGRVTKEGNFELFGDLKVHGDVQRLGKRIEVWQNVVTTGDNLIELNDNLEDTKVPYSGIEVGRGEEPPAFLLFTEDDRRWSVSLGGVRRKVALHGDKLSNFDHDLTTDDIEEGEENKYARPTTSTHNFWVSDVVQKTVGTDKQILPAFVSVGEEEKKFVTKVRSTLSAGSAKIVLLLNGKQKGNPMAVGGRRTEKMDLPLEDGDKVGVGILDSSKGRNLSVSIEVTRHVAKR